MNLHPKTQKKPNTTIKWLRFVLLSPTVSYRKQQGISEAENGEQTENLASKTNPQSKIPAVGAMRQTSKVPFIGGNAHKI